MEVKFQFYLVHLIPTLVAILFWNSNLKVMLSKVRIVVLTMVSNSFSFFTLYLTLSFLISEGHINFEEHFKYLVSFLLLLIIMFSYLSIKAFVFFAKKKKLSI